MTPLFFAALGLLSERAGTFAVGTEGMMLAGAFGGAVATLLLGSSGAGLAVRARGRCVALVVAAATVKFHADQMVTGLAVNILATAHASCCAVSSG